MKELRLLFLFIFLLITSSFFAAPEEPNLNSIKTIKDAEKYFDSCRLIVYNSKVSRDSIASAIRRTYYLGKWIGMSSMSKDEVYKDNFGRIKISTQEDKNRIIYLKQRIVYTYKALQGFSGLSYELIDRIEWMNIETEYSLFGKKLISYQFIGNIGCFEYAINGFKFIVFHNNDKNFAYDLKVYHREKYYSKKKKRNIYETLTRNVTLMPETSFFLTCTLGKGFYFKPSSINVTGKYYVGNYK